MRDDCCQKKGTPFILCLLSFSEISHLKGDRMFRSIGENGEWGTPEHRRINLKLLFLHLLIFNSYSKSI